jgi:hypothetical protein
MRIRKLAVLGAVVALAGCYHAVVETGLTPSPTVIDRPWASGWVYGLVPPKPLSTMAQCPNGPAKVETQLSFLNMLVGSLTLGIYTPMSIRVTCAQGGARSSADGVAPRDVRAVSDAAAEVAVEGAREIPPPR